VFAADDDEDVIIAGDFAEAIDVDGTIASGSGDVTSTDAEDQFADPTLVYSSAVSTGVAAEIAGTPQSLTLVAGDFTVKIGNADAVDLAGTYENAQALADAINSKVAGAFASIDENGVLTISAGDRIMLGGSMAGAGVGNLGFADNAYDVQGNLTDANVLTREGANDTILRVDSALTQVSTLRSTLGAIQNRFQSTINSLQAVSENLSASRSRILDADFAAETAAMTRAQILQQAGTAMVAQANAVPQNVLSLLR
jgi:flagellin